MRRKLAVLLVGTMIGSAMLADADRMGIQKANRQQRKQEN